MWRYFSRAEQSLKQALELKPDSVEILSDWAECMAFEAVYSQKPEEESAYLVAALEALQIVHRAGYKPAETLCKIGDYLLQLAACKQKGTENKDIPPLVIAFPKPFTYPENPNYLKWNTPEKCIQAAIEFLSEASKLPSSPETESTLNFIWAKALVQKAELNPEYICLESLTQADEHLAVALQKKYIELTPPKLTQLVQEMRMLHDYDARCSVTGECKTWQC